MPYSNPRCKGRYPICADPIAVVIARKASLTFNASRAIRVRTLGLNSLWDVSEWLSSCLSGKAPSKEPDVIRDCTHRAEAVAPGSGNEQRENQNQGQQDKLPVLANDSKEGCGNLISDNCRISKNKGTHHSNPRQTSLKDLKILRVLIGQLPSRSPKLNQYLLGCAEGANIAAIRCLTSQNDRQQYRREKQVPINIILPSRPVPNQQ